MKKQSRLKVVRGNKNELYLSMAAPFLTAPYYAVLPHNYASILIGIGVFSLAFVCALNAIMDVGRMHWIEKLIALPWFCLLAFYLPLAIWQSAHIQVFSAK